MACVLLTAIPHFLQTLEILSINTDGDGGAKEREMTVLDDVGNRVICKDCFASLSVGKRRSPA
jgi:hypothetical protein